jgi:hypothetical protein
MRFRWPHSEPKKPSAEPEAAPVPAAEGNRLDSLARLIERGGHETGDLERLAKAIGQDGPELK